MHRSPLSFHTAILAVIMVVLLPIRPAAAQYNCHGSHFADGSGADANRTCTRPEPVFGEPAFSGPAYRWSPNLCSDSWLRASCEARGGTITVGAECGQANYCVGANDEPDDEGMAELADAIVEEWTPPDCEYTTTDSGWGYSGTVVEQGYSVTLGPEARTAEGVVTTSERLFTSTLDSGPSNCPSVRHHASVYTYTPPYQCPPLTQSACPSCGNYCVSDTGGTCPANNPVDMSIGVKLHAETDFAGSGGPGSLSLTRTYNSGSYFNPTGVALDGHTSTLSMARGGMFGFRWRSTYDRRLFPVAPTISYPPYWYNAPTTTLASIQRPDGTIQHFRTDGLEALPKPDKAPARLTRLYTSCPTDQTQACWEYRSGADEVELYSGEGLLLEIADRATGQAAQRMTYDSQYRLATVTDAKGRVLTFAYAGFRVTSATLPDGKVISYTYDSSDRLIKTSYPVESGQPAAERNYYYEDTRSGFQQFLTGVADENGDRFTTIAYDSNGRVASTVQAPDQGGGVNQFSYTYSFAVPANPTTTYTNPLGAQTVLTTEYWHGSVRLKQQSQPCTTCGTANISSRTYDTNGFIDKVTDFRGVITDHDYNSRGLETVRRDDGFAPGPFGCPYGSNFYSSNYTTSCTQGTCWATQYFPGLQDAGPGLGYWGWFYACAGPQPPGDTPYRITYTDWHSTLSQPVERRITDANDVNKQVDRWTYTAGRATARCAVDPTVSGAMSYTCGSQTNAPAGVRQTSTTYCQSVNTNAPDTIGSGEDLGKGCPLVGLLRRVNGPRTDADDWTTYEYRLADESSCATSGACTYRKGDLWKVINAASHVTEYVSYDKAGRATRLKDANGVITDLAYHPRGWLATRTVRANANGSASSDDATTTIGYDAVGNVARVTQPDGSYVDYTYDQAHRLTDITDADGNTIHYTLDAAGNRIKEETKLPNATVKRVLARQYDTLSHLQKLYMAPYANDPNGSGAKFTEYSYDANSNPESVTDARGTESENEYDALNRLISTIQDVGGIGAEVEYEYDLRDNLVRVNDPKNLDTTYTYDGLNNLTQLASPDTGSTIYTYDAAGNRLTQTDARSVTATYGYDALNRLETIEYPTSSLDVSFEYDDVPTDCETGETFGLGRLSRMTDATGETRFCYDRRGNLARKVQVTDGETYETSWTYDKADRVETMHYPSGTVVDFGRDALGRVTSIDVPASPDGAFGLVDEVTYLPFGPVSGITFANSRATTRQYDQNYWIDSITNGSGSTSLDFTTDDLGNIVGLASSGAATYPRTYAYDDLSRLTEVLASGTPIEEFTYDATGNRLTKDTGTTVTYTYPSTSHRLQSVGGVSRTYDNAGNSLTGLLTSTTNSYDDRGRLASVQQTGTGTLGEYGYNARGERVMKDRPTTSDTRSFVYDVSGHLIGEYDASTGAPLNEVVWLDDLPIALVRAGSHFFIEPDHLGTPRAVIAPTANTPVWRMDLAGPGSSVSAVFGDSAPVTDPDGDSEDFEFNLRFPGQYYDAETGLHYNYFRDYEPTTGRYIESDPIGLEGGPSTYRYASAQPLRDIDALGLLDSAPWPPPTTSRLGNALRLCARVVVSNPVVAVLAGVALPRDTAECDTLLPTPDCPTKCPPCVTVSGTTVPVGTIAYRPLDVIPDNVRQHGRLGSHHNLFKANQMPYPTCDCFWQKLKDVAKPEELQSTWIPIEPFLN